MIKPTDVADIGDDMMRAYDSREIKSAAPSQFCSYNYYEAFTDLLKSLNKPVCIALNNNNSMIIIKICKLAGIPSYGRIVFAINPNYPIQIIHIINETPSSSFLLCSTVQPGCPQIPPILSLLLYLFLSLILSPLLPLLSLLLSLILSLILSLLRPQILYQILLPPKIPFPIPPPSESREKPKSYVHP